jgi:hypothetical protein
MKPVCEAKGCKWHGKPMKRHSPGTPEQEFCVAGGGELWRCEMCFSSVLSPGAYLQAFLAGMKPAAKSELSLQPNA